VKRLSWPGLAIALGALLLTAVILYAAPSDRYIFLPDEAKALAPLVDVEGEKPDRSGGGIFYVAVDVRKATLLEKLVPGLNDGSTLVPEGDVLPEGVDEDSRRRSERAQMRRSQEYAAAVALRKLGFRVRTRSLGVLVDGTFSGYPAAGKLLPEDFVRSVDGEPVRKPRDLTELLRRHRPGDVVHFRVERQSKARELSVRTVADPRRPGRPFVGISIAEVFDVRLPIAVDIDLGRVGGPSAGLAFALDLMEELGRDVDHGRRVAATGELGIDGSVIRVGGLKQKTIAARRSGMDVFLVPGDNAPEARRHAEGLRIVPVDSFQQALRELATLPASA
jgi:Lon-like protease